MAEPAIIPPNQRWAMLKTRGGYTREDIDVIDRATPWVPVEPTWWLEMMQAREVAR